MYMNCITNSPIKWGEEVKLFFICPNFKDYQRGTLSENDFSVIGFGFDAVYNEKMRFEVNQKTNNYLYSKERFLKMNKKSNDPINKDLTYRMIEKKINNGTFHVLKNNENTFVNLMAIKKSVYERILLSDSIMNNDKLTFKDFKKEIDIKIDFLSKLFDDANKVDPIDQEKIMEFSLGFSEISRDFFRYFSFSLRNSFNELVSNRETFVENLFILDILEKQGYFIQPSQDHSEGNNKVDFLEKLLVIQQEKESDCFFSFKEV